MDTTKSGTKLDLAYKAAQIFALLGTPVVVAAVGWSAQHSAVEVATRKDYVQIAVQVLRDPLKEDAGAIKAWAIGVIQAYSPVPFSAEAGRQLSQSAIDMLENNPLLKPAMQTRPPCQPVDVKALPPSLAKDVAQLYSQCITNQQDLFWLKTYVGLITDPAADTQGEAVAKE